MRKLLPYEQHLIEALGISEEEYWQFYLARLNYRDPKEGTVFDVRNEAGTIALVLTIVGTLAQVGAALLAPKPQVPDQKMGRQSRNQFFAPRYGFNSFQEVARYGEPINLIYTNIDENKTAGGLRVNTSLVWSAVHSFGTSQYMQMLATIGAGPIQSFGYGRTAFGQTPLRDLASQRYFLYANESQGRLFFNDKKLPSDVSVADDPVYTTGNDNLCSVIANAQNRTEGYSQAFSPTTSSSLGLYDVVPLRVQVEDRDDEGRLKQDSLGINVTEGRGIYWPATWPTTGVRPALPKGNRLTITFEEDDKKPTEQVERAAIDLRSAYIGTFDSASTYKIGAAKFKLVADNIQSGSDIEGSFVFECTESGVLCEEDYSTRRYQQNEEDLRRQKREAEDAITALEAEKGAAFAERFKGPGADKIAAFDTELEQIDDAIESATAILKGDLSNSELLNVVKDEGTFKGIRDTIDRMEGEIKTLNDEIENLQDEISDILELRPVDRTNRQKERLREAKGEKKDKINKKKEKKVQLRDEFARLSTRAIEQGLYDSNKNTNLREERKQLKIRRRRITKRRTEAASVVERDSAAESTAQSAWTTSYNAAVANLNSIVAQLKDEDSWNDYFNTKCIAKIDEIRYECVTKCEVINFSFKAKVFQRIQGRMNKYAEVDQQGHKDSDNGIRNRTSMFWLWYKKPSDPVSAYTLVPYVFGIRNGKELDAYVGLRFIAPSKEKWQFKLEPIVDLAAELRTHNNDTDMPMIYLRTAGYRGTISGQEISFGNGFSIVYKGRSPVNTIRRRPPLNRTPKFVDEWGLFSLRSDTQISFSFESGAEISLVAVTEQQKQALTPSIYDGMAMLGLNIYSGQGVRDLRSLSVWVNKGKKVRKFLDTNGNYGAISESTSYAPEIFLDTILDEQNGIAAYANINGIDTRQLSISQRFCEENQLFMDGVIADPTSWREFWSQIAPFSLLEFARIGGKETLIPAVPYDSLYRISRAVQISALFNQGNILEDSYKEEFLDYGDNTQDLIATVVYRDTANDNVFPQNRSVQIVRADAIEADSIRQTFDLSAFVSSREQAVKYGKLLCQQRRFSRRAIEFKTFPTESPVAPGSYVYVQLDQNQWDDIRSGIVEEGGRLNIPLAEDAVNGSFTMLLYNGQDSPTKLSSVSIANNQSSAFTNYEGWLFVLGTQLTTKRVFRVTGVSMEEEGEITISAVEHQCDESGGATLSKIANFEDAFLVE
jgi:hypothetical protein